MFISDWIEADSVMLTSPSPSPSSSPSIACAEKAVASAPGLRASARSPAQATVSAPGLCYGTAAASAPGLRCSAPQWHSERASRQRQRSVRRSPALRKPLRERRASAPALDRWSRLGGAARRGSAPCPARHGAGRRGVGWRGAGLCRAARGRAARDRAGRSYQRALAALAAQETGPAAVTRGRWPRSLHRRPGRLPLPVGAGRACRSGDRAGRRYPRALLRGGAGGPRVAWPRSPRRRAPRLARRLARGPPRPGCRVRSSVLSRESSSERTGPPCRRSIVGAKKAAVSAPGLSKGTAVASAPGLHSDAASAPVVLGCARSYCSRL